ncbi:MAG TPA: DNA repair protein RecN [Bryobacteraceae bacterium]|nr:DNA repair protein RecN [Bryobacteraceae bacterium]
MLVELTVENYAVVERVRVSFHQGLNLLTGETGSGKSIVVDALALLFGGRASADMVRSGAERARISGIFQAPRSAEAIRLLEEGGIETEDGELLLEREVFANGKSRAFAGGRATTAALLRELAPHLGDIHGQNEQQQLFLPSVQLAMLDVYGATGDLSAAVRGAFRRWKDAARELADLEKSEQERLRLADLWSFQRREIEGSALSPGEDIALDNERRVLKNVARLQEAAAAAYEALYDHAESAYAQLRTAQRRVEELSRIDESLRGVSELLAPAGIGIEEAAATLRDYLDRLEADPKRLDAVESRLDAIDKLKRKYGATVDEILVFLEDVRRRMGEMESSQERRALLEKERSAAEAEYREAAGRLTAARTSAARRLEQKLKSELASLALGNSEFRVSLQEAEWAESGADRVEFQVSANVGEEPRALDKVASGGELSRIALALKTCIGNAGAAHGEPRTLVFDEVDAGIGGSVAEAVGRRLKKISAANQVLCVTHLPQVASFASHHYVVEKRLVKGRTVAEVEEVTGDARTREIGRMLSGQQVTPEALKNAEQMIRLGAKP